MHQILHSLVAPDVLLTFLTPADAHRFVQSNAFKEFIKRDGHLKYNEFGTARPTLESLPVIAAGVTKLGQGMTTMQKCNINPVQFA